MPEYRATLIARQIVFEADDEDDAHEKAREWLAQQADHPFSGMFDIAEQKSTQ